MLPRLYLAFRSPVFGSEEYYAASVTGAILGMRRGSRLYRTLVRERQIAAEATAFTFDLPKGSDLLVIDVTARPGVEAEVVEREVAREIDVLQADGVTSAEVERARRAHRNRFHRVDASRRRACGQAVALRDVFR